MTIRQKAVEEMNRAFTVLNQKLFGGELQPPPVVLDLKKKHIVKYQGEVLVIGSKLAETDQHDFLLALLHEMIHVRHGQAGVADVTANQYHNRKFLSAAVGAGLVVKKHKTQCWAITGTNIPKGGVDADYCRIPTKQAVERRLQAFKEVAIDASIFDTAREDIRRQIAGERPPKACFLKYVCNCPPPHNSIRSGRKPHGDHPLRIICEVCKGRFVCVS